MLKQQYVFDTPEEARAFIRKLKKECRSWQEIDPSFKPDVTLHRVRNKDGKKTLLHKEKVGRRRCSSNSR